MANAREVLSQVSGIPEREINEIWEQVKANHARLDSCAGPHDFSIEGRKQGQLVRDWQCSKCGGTLDSVNVQWYRKGLADHG